VKGSELAVEFKFRIVDIRFYQQKDPVPTSCQGRVSTEEELLAKYLE